MRPQSIRWIFAVFSIGALVVLFYFVVFEMLVEYRQGWNGRYLYEAYRLYNAGGLYRKNLPDHSIDGFPLLGYSVASVVLSTLLFVLMKVSLRMKKKASIICSGIMLILLLILVTFSAIDYYNHDYKRCVEEAYSANYDIWRQLDYESKMRDSAGVAATLQKE